MNQLSARSEAITRRTYNRPLDDEGSTFETWAQTVRRSHYEHHVNLWEGAGGKPDLDELEELNQLGMERKGLVSGRTLWLGGTEYAYSRSASQFNCSALSLCTVFDMVDAFWLLLNGCGVGGKPQSGTLHGYYKRIPELEIVPSERGKDYRGRKANIEIMPDESNNYVWTIDIGDSAEAWAKSLGKMLVSPRKRVDKLRVVFTETRGPGGRLKGYGWICNGYVPMANAVKAVHAILNRTAGNLLSEEDIGDIFNWMGTVLSSRRAAEALVMDQFHPLVNEFATRKKDYWLNGNDQRRQSNNSILFWRRPSVDDIADLLKLNLNGGEPGFVNASAALHRCPWFQNFNPCFEIVLPSHGFCNLVSVSLPHFGRDFTAMERAVYVMSRANYRQTCVNLEDGLLQPRWHQTNESLRLCGVSLTGIVQAGWLTDYQIRRLRNAAISGAYSMADELGLPRPKAVTTIKPEGTRSKISGTVGMEIGEGMHAPLGQHIFNWINFSTKDPLVSALESAGYKTLPNPSDPNNVLVRFPVEYTGCGFKTVNGRQVNTETAIDQLERYKRWNTLWADHNVSATVSLDPSEVGATAEWLHANWDSCYVATAFLRRTDPSLTPADIGQPYLPQEVVTEEAFRAAQATLKPVDWDRFHTGWYEIDQDGCAGGVCPVK